MNKKGFTLVEVIATVALLAILIGLAGTSLIKKYNESKKEAINIQEGQLVQSGDMVIQDFCKNPLSEAYQLQCDNYYQSYEDSNNNLIIEDNTYTKYICVRDLKKLGYYSEELVYSGVECSGVVIYKIDYETDLQKDSYSVIKCGEDYTTEVENVNDYLTIFKECFETQNSEQPEEEKKYLLTVNFTELTPNGMKVGISHSKEYKKGQSISINVPEHKTFENEYTPFKHGSSVNANNFKLSSDKTKLTGTMPEGNVTVNIVYSASTYVLTVNYKEFNDVQGNINFPSKQFIMFYGEKTEIPYEEKENFKVISPSDFTYEMEQSDDEIDVIYQQEKFKLTYNSNGGTACNSRQVIYNKAYGSLCSPTRTGYTFDGWYLNGKEVESTDINNNYSNITLTAHWIANKYTVLYNCNGGTPTNNYSSEHTYDQVSNLTNNYCGKKGYVFTYWKDSEGNTYTNQKEIKNLRSENNDSITLTAQWEPLIYYIAFNSNSGSGTMSKMTVTYGQVVNLTSNAFTMTGHRFDGWSGSDGKTYADRAAISNLTTVHGSTITMTAKWTKCGAGTYLANNVCTACAAGTYSTGGVNSCTACPAGKYTSSTGQSSCSTCAAGTYNTGTGNTSCKLCDVGYYCTGGSHKAACEAGKYSTGGASSCTTCTAGYYCPGSSDRVVCAAGKYNSNTGSTAASACTNCSAGYYSSAGASSCTGCPAGKYSAVGASTCTTCTAGYYCPGSSNRVACAAGMYNSNTGSSAATACTNCSAGYYSAAGASSCTGCPAGKYSAAGASSCTSCPSGYTSASGATAQNKCYIAVSAGKYIATANSSTQTNCAAGTYKEAHTVYYGSTSSCINCATCYTSSSGSSSCPTKITYTITFNTNGGSGGPSSQTKTCGTTLTLSSSTPTKSGYRFTGWKASDGTLYVAGGNYAANEATTMTAQWIADSYTCKRNFDECSPPSNHYANPTMCFVTCKCGSGGTCTYSYGEYCFRHVHDSDDCSVGTKGEDGCYLYNQTSCPSGWTIVP